METIPKNRKYSFVKKAFANSTHKYVICNGNRFEVHCSRTKHERTLGETTRTKQQSPFQRYHNLHIVVESPGHLGQIRQFQ